MRFLKIHLVISIGLFCHYFISVEDNLLTQAVCSQRTLWSIQLVSSYLHTPVTQKLVFQCENTVKTS